MLKIDTGWISHACPASGLAMKPIVPITGIKLRITSNPTQAASPWSHEPTVAGLLVKFFSPYW